MRSCRRGQLKVEKRVIQMFCSLNCFNSINISEFRLFLTLHQLFRCYLTETNEHLFLIIVLNTGTTGNCCSIIFIFIFLIRTKQLLIKPLDFAGTIKKQKTDVRNIGR